MELDIRGGGKGQAVMCGEHSKVLVAGAALYVCLSEGHKSVAFTCILSVALSHRYFCDEG